MSEHMMKLLRQHPILMGCLIYALIAGSLSYWIGKSNPDSDLAVLINPLGTRLSQMVYNGYLLPYWQSSLQPIGYEQVNIVDLKTGKIIGQQKVPQYDFPIKQVSDLYIPVSIVFWIILGLGIDTLPNIYKRLQVSPFSSGSFRKGYAKGQSNASIHRRLIRYPDA